MRDGTGLSAGSLGAGTVLPPRPAGTRAVNVASAALLLVLFAVSLNSLTSFPDSFADEGHYGEAGFSLITTGRFTPYDLPDVPQFRSGDGIRPHLVSVLFGCVGRWFGYTLSTARAISFILLWAAILLWLPLTKSFRLPPFLGALVFASSERVFWASHVFRPEATLVLVNTVLVLSLVVAASAASRAPYWVGRGLLNGALVLAHGNGLVSAIVNSLDAMASCVRLSWRVRLVRLSAYAGGALLALGAFYLIQVETIGGWRVFFDQLSAAKQYLPHSGVVGMVRSEIETRWARELVVVGASPAAKLMRGLWYATVLAAALWSVLGSAGLARRLALIGFGTIVGYTFLVHDRADIHIAEMVPFLCAAFLAWVGNAAEAGARRGRIAQLAVVVLVVTGLGLCGHHSLKYRPQVYRTAPAATAAAIRSFVETRSAGSQPPARVVVGDENLWFWLHGVVPVVNTRRASAGPALEGEVIVACDPSKLRWLDRCSLKHSDPERRFAAYQCPSAAPALR